MQLPIEKTIDNAPSCVHVAFMNPAPTASVQSAPPPREETPMAAPAKPSRSAALLQIVRTLIDIGRQRLAAIRAQPGPEETHLIACAFGTFNVALIVARILRGLRIAAALEERVIAAAPSLDTPPPARPTAAPRAPRPGPKTKRQDARDNAALLDGLPTDREIAEMVRGRPIGAVLVDICADLGIGMDHPLWQELRWIIIDHNGTLERVLQRTFQRINDARLETEKFQAPDFVFQSKSQQICDTTGPPPLLLAA